MVRFDKLKEATRDQIVAFIAQIAATFNVPEEELASIIPEDIRVRTDDGRKQPENDARNWGIVFLTLLTSITVRHVDGNLAMFQRDLRAVIADNNDDDQPWCTLDNLRQLKSLYEADNMRSSATPQEGEEEDLFAEQVGEEVQTGSKRSLGEGASLSQKGKRSKFFTREVAFYKANFSTAKRLRRSSVGWARPEKGKPTKKPSSKVTPSPSPSRVSSSSSGSEEEDPSQQ
jgi:hypothetical protein